MRKGIQKIYSDVAETYECINHILTFGMDRLWRKRASKVVSRLGGDLCLDVCSGTGEMAHHLSVQAYRPSQIYAVDFAYPMLAKAAGKKTAPDVFFAVAEAGTLPFPDETFDLVTISFATRNLNARRDILSFYLKELYRVLKYGGHFVNLETSQPPVKFIKKLFHLYVKLTVKPIGQFLSGSAISYRYLAFTIPRFYDAGEFSKILKQIGYSYIEHQPLFLGVAAIHTAKK